MQSVQFWCSQNQSEEHDQVNEVDLVTAAQAGSEVAFRELYRRNAGQVFRSISRVAKDRADAEDALQDTLARAFTHIRQFQRRSSFSTWLTRIGINSALMILRKKQRASETSIDSAEGDLMMSRQWDIVDLAANPEEHCLIEEMTGIVGRAICNMPLPLRIVTELRLVQNLDLHEIADTLKISIPATKSRLHRAKRRIAKTLRSTSKRETWLRL